MSPTPESYGRDPSSATFSVARYQRMVEVGILTPDDKVELLENYIVARIPRTPMHESTVQRIAAPLMDHCPADWTLRIHSSIVLGDSQPEPDFAVVRGSWQDYETRHPGPPDTGLVVEVADSSLLRDQRDKARIYARAGIHCYWIVNLVDRCLKVHSNPTGPVAVPSYQSFQTLQPGDSVDLVLDGVSVATLPVAALIA